MKWLKFVIFVSFCLHVNCKPQVEIKGSESFDDDSIRLPGHTRPINYSVELNVNIHNGTLLYSGRVGIKIAVDVATDFITLHSKALSVSQVLVTDSNDDVLMSAIQLDTARDFLIINVDEPLIVGDEYYLDIPFEGVVSTGLNGLYRISYKNDITNETRYLAATKFEPAYLRSAIICYDEPALKASFELKITHDVSLTAIANTEGFRTPNSDGTVTTLFEPTPIMSPYLLAFVVSDFAYSELQTGRTLHRIHSRSEAVSRTQFALKNTDLFLKELERYAGFDYELTKVDQAALPDFQSGGMENWGLITYKEQYLIVDEHSHHREITESIRVTSHEIAHQFFGNAVTCEWWDAIWIQEGLATVFEYHTSHEVLPQYRMKHLFNLQLQNGLRVDADEAVRAMTSNVDTNEELPGVFDRIAYDKSGSVLRMFQQTVGDEIFRAGLNRLLVENNHKSVRPQHVYEAFQFAMDARNFIDFRFADAFGTWELQSGHPVIHVAHDKALKQFRVTQKRYLNVDSGDVVASNWFIPLNFAHANKQDFEDTTITHYFEHGTVEKIIPVDGINNDEWFVFNKQQFGFYRVNYDIENWQNIINTLNSENFQQIHVLNRAQLVDDAMNFAIDGHMSFDVAFGVLMYLQRETDYLPWASAVNYLDRLDYLLLDEKVRVKFHQLINHLVSRLYTKLGLHQKDDEEFLNKNAREIAINWSCRTGNSKCLIDANEEVRQAMTEGKSIPKPLDIAFLCNALKSPGDKTEIFLHYWKKMRDSTDQADRLRIIDGLACSSQHELIKNFLESSTGINSDVTYRLHERARIFNSILSSSSVGIMTTLDFISRNFLEIQYVFQQSPISFLVSISKRVVTIAHENRMMRVLSELSDLVPQSDQNDVAQNINYNKNFHRSGKVVAINSFIDRFRENEANWRLPKASVPSAYNLHLTSNIHSDILRVEGEVSIKLSIAENTDRLTLHSRDIVIEDLSLLNADGVNEVAIMSYSLHTPTEMLTVYLMDDAIAGTEFVLHVKYAFAMNEAPNFIGLYRTSYVGDDGQKRYLAATHLVHANARSIMPCYDEPAMPAVFRLSITHHESYQAVSNTLGSRRVNSDETVTTVFEETPLIAPYLLGFVISDFEFHTNELTKGPDDTLIRVSTRKNADKTTKHALEINEKILKDFEDYLDFKYELPKYDSVAVTGTDGPIVVWGLICYPEEYLLHDEVFDDMSHTQRLEVVSVLAHEIIHQFFGNAVLIDFWSHLWLIEGFTTIFEWQLVGNLHPDWRTRDFFNLKRLQSVFTEDESNTAPAVTEIVETLDEIWSNFGSIAYDKAGTILRMFQNTLGEETFRDALRNYVKVNHHKTVVPSDLHLEFENVLSARGFVDFNFTEAFKTWELQKGFPVIHVKHDKANKQFVITQKRYFIDSKLEDDANSSWFIPLNFATSDSANFADTTITHYFEHGTDEKVIALEEEPEWFVFNKQQLGYYRVNYDLENWQNIVSILNSENFQQIHVLNRAQLVDDAMSFAAAGLIDYDLAFDVLKYLRYETDYVPWASGAVHLNRLIDMFGKEHFTVNLFVRLLSENLYAAYETTDSNEIPNEPLVDRFSRDLAIYFACMSGNRNCLADTFMLTRLVGSQERVVPKGLEELVYCNAVKKVGNVQKTAEWGALWQKMQDSNDPEERSLIIRSLGCSGDEETLSGYLKTSISNFGIVNFKEGERLQIFDSVLSSSIGVQVITAFLEKHEDFGIEKIYSTSLEDLITSVAASIKDQNGLNLITWYFEKNPNVSSNFIADILMQIRDKLNKQLDEGPSKQLAAMEKISFQWEPQTTTQVITETSTTEDTTTEGASSLSLSLTLLLVFAAIINWFY